MQRIKIKVGIIMFALLKSFLSRLYNNYLVLKIIYP